MKKQVIAILSLLKNTLTEEGKEYAQQIEKIISEAEAAPEQVNEEELEKMLDDVEALKEDVEQNKEIQNKLKKELSEQIVSIMNLINKDTAVKKINPEEKEMGKIYNAVKAGRMAQHGASLKEIHKVENAVTTDGLFLPKPIATKIIDSIDETGTFYNLLNKTGLPAIEIGVNEINQMLDTARAGAHTDNTDKQQEVMSIVAKEIVSRSVFTYIEVNRSTVSKMQNANPKALLDYVASKIGRNHVREVEQAILVGDNRIIADDRKIKSFEKLNVLTSDVFRTVVPAAASDFATKDEIFLAVQKIKSGQNIVAFMSRAQFAQLARTLYATGGTPIYRSSEELANELGVKQIIKNDLVTADNNTLFIAFDLDAYEITGDTTPENITDYDIKRNMHQFEGIADIGGGLTEVYSAVTIKPLNASGD